MLYNLKFEIRLALLRQSLYHAHIARSANQYSISNASGGKNSNNCGVDFVFPSETFDDSEAFASDCLTHTRCLTRFIT